jgi:glycosyltransferase involved in cell wall biosynthesis
VPAFIGREFLARARRDAPVVQTQHGWGINKTAEQAAFDIDVLRSVDRIVTTSRATAQLLGDYGAPRGHIDVIPCGLPLDAGGTAPRDADPVRRLRAAGRRVIGCIGSVTANKNQRLLLDALEWLDDPGISALFIGEGSEDLGEDARERGIADRVVTVGYQPDAARWLPLLDALVAPSRTEGQGLVVLEAFRAGVPVVASHIPAFTELIDDGRNGFVFAPLTAAALAGTIRRALALPPAFRADMVAAARQQFERDFTVDAMVRRHEALYREVIEARTPVGGGG